MADELLLPYIRESLKVCKPPTANGYWSYCTNSLNPNYLYVQQTTFTYLHAMMMLRKGIRYGQSLPILAAKSKLALLFFGRNHPRYQVMTTHDFRIGCLIPNEIKDCMHSTLSLSRTGRHGHYQSGDAMIEEINKQAKKWVIGVPTQSQWKRSFRNLDNLDEVNISFL